MQGNDKQRRAKLQKLFVNWLIHLLDERFGVSGWGTPEASHWSVYDGQHEAGEQGTSEASAWRVTLEDGNTIHVGFKPSGQPDVQGPAKYEGVLASIVQDADRRTVARDYGAGAWWMVSRVSDMRGSGVAILHLMRLRNEHMTRQFQGDWRMGSDVLLSFRQMYPSTSSPIPMFNVDIAYRVQGPGPGPFSQERAEERGTLLRAVTSFETGAPLLDPGVFIPMNTDAWVSEVKGKLGRASELPIYNAEGPSLWPEVTALAQASDVPEDVRRVQGALFAYEQAIRQESEYVTIVLLVSALEALSVPNFPKKSWREERVTTRFLRFVQELSPDAVSDVMNHENFAEAFGSIKNPRRFLDDLYSSRSEPLHTGFLQHAVLAPMGGGSPVRVMLVSRLVRAGIVEFLRRPFSSLIGHPATDRPPTCRG
jgi:hypothetical protein